MPIRDHHSAQSGVEELENKWFRKQEKTDTDPNRFIFMPKGTRDKIWDMRVDLSTMNLNDEDWMIDHDKYVNRPDAIAHKFYGNSKYWWAIAERNGITDPFHGFYKGRQLKIPNLVSLRQALGM